MLTHYLLTLYRSLSRHRLYAAINVLGLAVGIAVFLVLFLDVRFETGFERWIPNAEQIYAVRTRVLDLPPVTAAMGALLDELKGDFPQLVGTRMKPHDGTVRQGDRITAEQIQEVDPTFFQVFDLPLAAGDRRLLLNAPDQAVITQAVAQRYFGDHDPIGQTLTLDFDDRVNVYRVAGVIRNPPSNTDFNFDILVPLRPPEPENTAWNSWGNVQGETYLRFKTPDEAKALDGELDRFADRHGASQWGRNAHKSVQIRLKPLRSLHLMDPADATAAAALGAVGALTLLLAAVNYVNLATARAGLRAREVAIRKVMGATRQALMLQFIGEALATAALAALIGAALCELALPLVNAAGGMKLRLDYLGDPLLIGLILGAVAVVGCGAGVYPALVLARFQPAAVLASARAPGGGRMGTRVREALVVFQFAIAISFTIATAIIVSQTAYVKRADLGFQREGLIIVKSFNHFGMTEAQHTNLLTAWRNLPGVVQATESGSTPGAIFPSYSLLKRQGALGKGLTLQFGLINPDFFETYRPLLIAGRFPDRKHGADMITPSPDRRSFNAVLNEKAVRALGFANPKAAVGALIQGERGDGPPIQIIGVIKDLRFDSPRAPLAPTIYAVFAGEIPLAVATVRYSGGDARRVIENLATTWRRIVPTEPFSAEPLDQALAPYYRPDDEHGRLFIVGAFLAVAIGCVGLYGLASFNTARRVKEIGIRKTLGASTADLLKLLIGQFLRPVVVANLFAWPLAWWVMSNWLSGFDQRIALTPAYFIAATALTLLIAVATVAGHAYAVARAEPAKALRDE